MNLDLKKIAEKYKQQLLPIKVFLVDVDGILTDCSLYYAGEEVGFLRSFNVLDGYAFKFLMKAGIKVGVISGGNSIGLIKRMEDLKPTYLHLGNEDKREAYLKVKEESGCEDHEILYMGDEHFDIPLLKRVGFSATAPHANIEVKEVVHYITHAEGGKACVREVADLLRYAQGFRPQYLDFEN